MPAFAANSILIEILYLVASALFILSLKWLSSPTTARHGIWAGEIGMLNASSKTSATMSLALRSIPRPEPATSTHIAR